MEVRFHTQSIEWIKTKRRLRGSFSLWRQGLKMFHLMNFYNWDICHTFKKATKIFALFRTKMSDGVTQLITRPRCRKAMNYKMKLLRACSYLKLRKIRSCETNPNIKLVCISSTLSSEIIKPNHKFYVLWELSTIHVTSRESFSVKRF